VSAADGRRGRFVPRWRGALPGQHLSAPEQAAAGLLAGWNGSMTAASAAAAVWWTFWGDYLAAVFGPWWRAAKVPVHLDRAGLAVSPQQFSLDQVLEAWTVAHPGNRAVTAPGGPRPQAPTVTPP